MGTYIKSILSAFAFLWAVLATALPMLVGNYSFLTGLVVAYLPLVIIGWKEITKDKSIFIILVLAVLSHYISYDGKLGTVVQTIIAPLLAINFIKHYRGWQLPFTVLAFVLFFVNSAIAIYEYQNNINLLGFDLTFLEHFRATGLWQHPLYSALLHCSAILLIICSRIPEFFKILIFFFGLYVIFMFDARLSTILLVVGASYIYYLYGYLKIRNAIILIAVLSVGLYFYDYLSTNELGGKLFKTQISNDSSLAARLIAFEIFINSDFSDILFGTNKYKFFNSYNVIEIENGIIEFIYLSGAIIVIPTVYSFVKGLYQAMKRMEKTLALVILASYLFTGLMCAAYSKPYYWMAFAFFYQGFGPYKLIQNNK